MTISPYDLLWRGSAEMPDDDTPDEIGGAIALARKITFQDVAGDVQVISSEAADTTQAVEVFGRDVTGAIVSAVIALNGLTPVTDVQVFAKLLKAVKDLTCAGDVAIESQTPEFVDDAVSGAPDFVILPSGASAVDGTYEFMVARITAGTGAGQIREGVRYIGADRKLFVVPWDVEPDATSEITISTGMVFNKLPAEVMEVRRPFYDATANGPGGGAVDYFEKIFLKNAHATDTLLTATVLEALDASAQHTFALETTKDGTGTNGTSNNRKVAPSTGVGAFTSAEKAIPGDELVAAEAIGVWLKLSLGEGDPALETVYVPRGKGTTS